MHVLDDVIVMPATLPSQECISFEEKMLRAIDDLKKAHEASEQRRLVFEARIDKKVNTFVNEHRSGSRTLSIGNQIRAQNLNSDSFARMRGVAARAQAAIEDDEDFEEFDKNFPVAKKANVEDLEWNIRRDLDFKFLLVISFLVSNHTFSHIIINYTRTLVWMTSVGNMKSTVFA